MTVITMSARLELLYFVMPPNTADEDISHCLVRPSVHSFVWSSIVTTISRERLEQFVEIYRQYSLDPTDDLIRIWS